MRLLIHALLFILMPLAYGQQLLDKKVSVKFENYTIERCLIALEKEAAVNFSYNSRHIHPITKKVKYTFKDETIRTILDFVLADTKLKYKELGNQITIYELSNSTEKAIISGYVRDKNSGEELIGARIRFPTLGIGCYTNSYGYYALEVPIGKVEFSVASLGMITLNDSVLIEDEMVLNFHLYLDTLLLNAVEIKADSIKTIEKIVNLPELDKTIITPNAIAKVPAIIGERDLLRHIQQLPGVQPSANGGANFHVRGSSTGGNMILIDEIPIYHPTHLLGLYSIVNTEALKTATLYKDFIPVKYGSRSASVLQITTNDGNLNRAHVSGGLSAFMARLNLEGPLYKKKSSFYLSSRASTFPSRIDKIIGKRQLGDPTFFDINGKLNFHLNSNNRIYFTGYFGNDNVKDSIANYKWGNTAGSFRWNHIIDAKTFSNLSVTHSKFSYKYDRPYTTKIIDFYGTELKIKKNEIQFGQKVVTDKISYDFTTYKTNSLTLNYGVSLSLLRTSKESSSDFDANLFLKRIAFENGVYASIEKKFTRRLKLNAGIRIPLSFHLGTGDTTYYLTPNLEEKQVVYRKNKLYDPAFFIDPRFLLSYNFSDKDMLQFSSIIVSQNTHIVNYMNYFLPIEIWTPSSSYLRPQHNFQSSIGWTHSQKNLHTSVILYNKFVMNVLDYASPTSIASIDIERNLLAGKLHVMGAEFMVNYAFTTWYSTSLAYSYTQTKQTVKGINNDKPYLAPGDRPHYWSFSNYINLSKKWQITTNFTFHTGTAVTLPTGQIEIDNVAFPIYAGDRNAQRLVDFKRFDISFKRHLGVKKNKNHWDLTLNITNLFNRINSSAVYVDHDPFFPKQIKIEHIDYTPFMISLNLNFKY